LQQQADLLAKLERKSGPKHEQHLPHQRSSLFPPPVEQTNPKRNQYAGGYRSKELAKAQNASADMLNRASWKGWITYP
jgi:hypothetical protein